MWRTVRKRTGAAHFISTSSSSLASSTSSSPVQHTTESQNTPQAPLPEGCDAQEGALSLASGNSGVYSAHSSGVSHADTAEPPRHGRSNSVFRMFVGSGATSSGVATASPPGYPLPKPATRMRGGSVSSARSSTSMHPPKPPLLHPIKSSSLSGVMAIEDPVLDPITLADSQSIKSVASSQKHEYYPTTPSPSIRAIFHATRVLVSDSPASILVNSGADAAALVARLALELIRNAREEGLNVRDRDKESRKTSDAPLRVLSSVPDGHASAWQDRGFSIPVSALATFNKASTLEAATSLGQALSSARESTSTVSTAQPSAKGLNTFGRLAAGSLISALMKRSSDHNVSINKSIAQGVPHPGSIPAPVSTNMGAPSVLPVGSSSGEHPTTTPRARTGTVELESLVPELARPPTLLLSKPHGSSLSSPNFKPVLPYAQASTGATRFLSVGWEPLTDRYGFIYVSKH